jgi:protein-S-isoprenylcysteine O-methyltransferase Ste14
MKPSPKFAVATIVSTVTYLGLAILGKGGLMAFFSQPALIALAVALVAIACVALFSSGHLGAGEREDRSNRWVIAALGVLGFLLAFIPAYTDRKGLWMLDGDGIRWLGVVLFVAGGALRLWPVFVLGHRFSGLVAIQPGHSLQTAGLYRIIRHPSYLGLLVSTAGWAIAFRSAIGVLLTALMIIPLVARIRSEEAMLQSQFGAEYDAYRARTAWRLFPGLY